MELSRTKRGYGIALALTGALVLLAVGCTSAGASPTASPSAMGAPAQKPSGTGAQVPLAPPVAVPSGMASPLVLQQGGTQQSGIWVSGVGEVTATPDIAVLSLGVESKVGTVAEANRQAAEAMNAVVNSLKANGVKESDIRTQYFNISPEYQYKQNESPIIIGYRVSNNVQAKIRTIDKTGVIIDEVVKAGGNLTRIQSISFSVDNPTPLLAQARQKAMEDANAKAKVLAAGGGVTLGRPTYISESGGYQTPQPVTAMRAMAAEAAAPTPISPGETQVQVSVQVVYAIQ